MISPRTRLAALKERWHQRSRDDAGVTLVELTLASTFMLIVLTLVGVTMSVITNIEGSVTSQYAEYDQALPALAPVQALLRAEVEPAPVNGGVPTPGFSQIRNDVAQLRGPVLCGHRNGLQQPDLRGDDGGTGQDRRRRGRSERQSGDRSE